MGKQYAPLSLSPTAPSNWLFGGGLFVQILQLWRKPDFWHILSFNWLPLKEKSILLTDFRSAQVAWWGWHIHLCSSLQWAVRGGTLTRAIKAEYQRYLEQALDRVLQLWGTPALGDSGSLTQRWWGFSHWERLVWSWVSKHLENHVDPLCGSSARMCAVVPPHANLGYQSPGTRGRQPVSPGVMFIASSCADKTSELTCSTWISPWTLFPTLEQKPQCTSYAYHTFAEIHWRSKHSIRPQRHNSET